MPKRKRTAKTLDEAMFTELLDKVESRSRRPSVDRTVFLLSYRAGLRVQEIAGLRWTDHVFNAKGEFDTRARTVDGKVHKVTYLYVGGDVGKCGLDRTLPMKADLVEAMRALRDDPARDPSDPYVVPSGRGKADQSLKQRAHALRMRMNRFYAEIGFHGCTSHSGRRTAITKWARLLSRAGGHLGDVQKLAGHANLETTEAYLDPSSAAEKLVDLL